MPITPTPSLVADRALSILKSRSRTSVLGDPSSHEISSFAFACLLYRLETLVDVHTAASVYRPLASIYLRSLSPPPSPHPMGRPPRCGLCQMPWSDGHNCLDDDLDPEILDAASNHGQDDLPEDAVNLHASPSSPCARCNKDLSREPIFYGGGTGRGCRFLCTTCHNIEFPTHQCCDCGRPFEGPGHYAASDSSPLATIRLRCPSCHTRATSHLHGAD